MTIVFIFLLLLSVIAPITIICLCTCIIAFWWIPSWWILKMIVYAIDFLMKKHKIWIKAIIEYVSSNTPGFLWFVVAPLIFFLYLLCLLFHSDVKWILIFQITHIVD